MADKEAPKTNITIQLDDSGESVEQTGTLIVKRGNLAVIRQIRITTAWDLTTAIAAAGLDLQRDEQAAEAAAAAKGDASKKKSEPKPKASTTKPDPVPEKAAEPVTPALQKDAVKQLSFM